MMTYIVMKICTSQLDRWFRIRWFPFKVSHLKFHGYNQPTCKQLIYRLINESESRTVPSDSLQPLDYTVLETLQDRILECVVIPFSNPGIKPRSPTLRADSLAAAPPGTPKNTGVGSLSLLQGMLLTQESNRGLQNCSWILYQLSYQGSPRAQFGGYQRIGVGGG